MIELNRARDVFQNAIGGVGVAFPLAFYRYAQ